MLSLPQQEQQQPTYVEAPYTTLKTRGGVLAKHTIDYILYNNEPLGSLAPLQLIGIGTIPNSSTQLPAVGLPDWKFPSDHLPIFALFDLGL